ncbi:MAG: CRISPR-associated helicase Cas3', partial [bacterium]
TYYRYWGKAGADEESNGPPCHLLAYHSLDVAAVATALLTQRPQLLARLSRLMGLGEDQTRAWVIYLLGLHDLGKFAESFQQLREDLRLGFWPDEKIRNKDYSLRHDALGWLLWREFLGFELLDEEFQDFIEEAMDYWLAAVTGHHGWPPDVSDKRERLKHHFRDFDQQAAFDFSRQWLELTGPDLGALKQYFDDADFARRQREASWLLAGIAVLSDWLGSNREYFDFIDTPMPLSQYWETHALPAAEEAVRQAGILPPPVHIMREPRDLFDYLEKPTPLQQACLDLPIEPEPQLFILEDVTGAGKTEAALILAARLMAVGQGEGVYIGLPTMATANAMYERMVKVYRRLYRPGDGVPSLILSHSARHLSKAFQQSLLALQADDPRYGDEESIVAQCNRWLADNRKKGLLADVGIGTIDQALLAAMPARHQSLRLLGLENKILILDEVHAYDAYTSEPLKRLITFHAALGGSVILLSATLTRNQREQLVSAFQGSLQAEPESMAYPLLTHASRGALLTERPVATRASVARQVKVKQHHEEGALLDVIRAAVEAGECVCWIRNTVADARSAWGVLRDAEWLKEGKLHLFHSRFALCDRLRIEQEMLERFGKSSTSEQRRGRVLIATQVVEQSLDLDFDRMISDLAPIDLLIQRAGRLHRHSRGERGQPVLDLLTPEPIAAPQPDWYQALFPKAHYVYPDTLILWRTAHLLQEKGGWRMPEDARDLLEFVYDEAGDIPPGLADASLAVEGETMSQRDAGRFASLRLDSGYRGGPLWDEDARIATRLGDESQTLYLARWENGQLLPWADEGHYRWDLSSLRIRAGQLRELAPINDTALRQAMQKLRELERCFDGDSFIVPLMETGEGWVAKARDEKGSSLDTHYAADTGLEIQKDGDTPPL